MASLVNYTVPEDGVYLVTATLFLKAAGMAGDCLDLTLWLYQNGSPLRKLWHGSVNPAVEDWKTVNGITQEALTNGDSMTFVVENAGANDVGLDADPGRFIFTKLRGP